MSRLIFAVAAVTATIVVGVALLNPGAHPGRTTNDPKSAAPQPPAPATWAGNTPLAQTPAKAPSDPVVSLAAKAKALAATGKPADAYMAWQVLASCSIPRGFVHELQLIKQAERKPNALEQAQDYATKQCGDLTGADTGTPRQIALLETAATAGIPGAALQLASLGPMGDNSMLYTRPNDQVVLDWRQRMGGLIHLAAENRDLGALQSLSSQYANGAGVIGQPDPVAAVKFAVAYKILREQELGGRPAPYADKLIAQLSRRLSPELAADAKRQGEEFAAATMKKGG